MIQYVFIIHSHTTFLTAMGVLDYIKADIKNAVFLYSRHYSNSVAKPMCKIIDTTGIVDRQQLLWNNKKRKGIIREIDSIINNVITDKYILYTPHFAMPFAQVLYTNKKCIKAAYIQEGGMIYRKAIVTHLSLRQKVRSFITDKIYRHSNRIWSAYGWYMPGKLYKQSDLDSYAISDDVFRNLPSNNHIIKWPHFDIPLPVKDHENVFVFDGFVKNHLVEQDFYLKKCKELVCKFAQEFNHIKFHPAQSEAECNKIISYFDQQECKYTILDNSIPFEIILSSTKGLSVIGFGSSLLYFARDLNHTVYCMDKWLKDSPLYMQYKSRYGLDDFNSL